MNESQLHRKPLQVVTACRLADLPILQLAFEGLRTCIPFEKLFVITSSGAMSKARGTLGAEVELIDEDSMIPGMTLDALRQLSVPGFPNGAGWYFQQLLKFAFCLREGTPDYYLIWDADTVPLRPLEFFDNTGRMALTLADERHGLYFDTYRKLLQEEPISDLSFISQHIIVQKEILVELLRRIDRNIPGGESWAWKIMRNLQGPGGNLFSEYETLGQFVHNNYRDRVVYRRLNWMRNGSLRVGGIPTVRDLERLGREYDFVAFESSQRPLRRFLRTVRSWIHRIADRH